MTRTSRQGPETIDLKGLGAAHAPYPYALDTVTDLPTTVPAGAVVGKL